MLYVVCVCVFSRSLMMTLGLLSGIYKILCTQQQQQQQGGDGMGGVKLKLLCLVVILPI